MLLDNARSLLIGEFPMTPVRDIPPADAARLLADDAKAIYLDVRTQREFEAGHVEGAYNVPLLDHDARGEIAPNPDFLRVVQANLPPETKLIVGCKSGQRSLRAAELLLSAGYANVHNLAGGLHGQRDMFGQVVEPGWLGAGLPTTTTARTDRTYPHLSGKLQQGA
jgi:rhodanese-related sulfurtransferase